MSLATKLGLKAVGDAPAKIEALRERRREYERGLGVLVVDMHARVNGLVSESRTMFDNLIRSGSIADQPRHEMGWVLAVAFVLASSEFEARAHAAIDTAAEAGHFNTTPRDTVEAKLAEFDRERRALDLVQQEAAVELAEAEARAAREVFNRTRQEIGG